MLQVLKASPQEITEECMAVLERFVVLIYDHKGALRKSTRSNNSSFQRSLKAETVSLPLEHDLNTTSKEHCFKTTKYVTKPSLIRKCFHNSWSPSWKAPQKHRNLLTNSFDGDADPHVTDDAIAEKLIWHTLVCATVAATGSSHKILTTVSTND